MAEEKTFYDGAGVKVTNTRIITPQQTYAMSGITSVTSREFKPSLKGKIILAVIGLVAFAVEWYIGALILGAAVAWWYLSKSEFTLFLSSASGESDALTSNEGDFILEVEEAVNEAIIARG